MQLPFKLNHTFNTVFNLPSFYLLCLNKVTALFELFVPIQTKLKFLRFHFLLAVHEC